jgi:excisionase family DNA binding protein
MAQKKSKSIKESILKDDVDFLTLEECANYLRVHYMTFYTWVQENKGPPIRRFSRQCIRVPKKSFLEWAESRSK